MTVKTISNFKLTAELAERIDGHYDAAEFVKLVNTAKDFLGSTTLFGTSYKIDLSNQIHDSDPYLTHVMYMPPSDSSGKKNFCPWATEGCRRVCLGIGSGRMNQGKENLDSRNFDWNKTAVSQAQFKRAELFILNQQAFIALMIVEIHKHTIKAANKNVKAASRPNGTTDILWEHIAPQLFEIFSDVQFYDYTKAPLNTRINKPENYHITYSRAETIKNQIEATKYLEAGFNAAVVFNAEKHNLPEEYLGFPVIDGDIHDMRFKDASGSIVGLAAKGAAKKDTSGFVVNI